MRTLTKVARRSATALTLAALTACSSAGGLGNILGSVLGGGTGQGSQVTGAVLGVDTRSQQLSIQQSNGQAVNLAYDGQTQVVYQNQNYPVTSLERGDQVTARVQSTSNGAYYTDLVQVDQSVSSAGSGTGSGSVQTLQGIVRQVDQANGMFTIDNSDGVRLVVQMPSNSSRTDVGKFQSLRAGDVARFYGVYLNNSRVELRQFY
jgi:hypothetical protein